MLVFTSCNSDFLDREPSNKYTDDILLTSTEGGMMLLNGTLRRTYISYESHAQYGQKAVDIMTDMLGEDYYTGDGYWNNYESWCSCMRSVINRKAVTPNWESPYIRIRPVREKPAVRWKRCILALIPTLIRR